MKATLDNVTFKNNSLTAPKFLVAAATHAFTFSSYLSYITVLNSKFLNSNSQEASSYIIINAK